MILVPSKKNISSIHGVGLFATELIPKGTKVWEFRPEFDLALSVEEIAKLTPAALEQVLNYAFVEDGKYVLCSDDARFINHSESPNLRVPDSCYAIRHIFPGEELTEDYREYGRLTFQAD